jgi:photosystem II stability/assembly factor-like uncharacterized protein
MIYNRCIRGWAIVWLAVGTLGCHDDVESAGTDQPVWPRGELIDVAVPAVNLALVLSRDGQIHLTRDGGATWQLGRVPAVSEMQGLSMADDRSGWAVGNGVILRTEEGGARWRRQRLPGRAADLDLRRLSAADERRAVAVGSEGLRLRTEDGGAVWQDVSLETGEADSVSSRIVDVSCASDGSGRCWVLDDGIRFSPDAGVTWSDVELTDSFEVAPIEFGVGRVEIPEDQGRRVRQAIEGRPRTADLSWQIDAGLTAREVERIGAASDPSALFALIEARVAEVRLLLEGEGIPAERIETIESPPWGYEDLLDDDPEFLARYWESRVEPVPRARIRVREKFSMTAIDVGSQVLGLSDSIRAGHFFGLSVGRGGRGLLSLEPQRSWQAVAIPVPHDLLDLAVLGDDRIVAVGHQGGLWISEDRATSWTLALPIGSGPFFDTLHAVAFDPSGQMGFVVGEQGRILRSGDRGGTWQSLSDPAQADPLSFR